MLNVIGTAKFSISGGKVFWWTEKTLETPTVECVIDLSDLFGVSFGVCSWLRVRAWLRQIVVSFFFLTE